MTYPNNCRYKKYLIVSRKYNLNKYIDKIKLKKEKNHIIQISQRIGSPNIDKFDKVVSCLLSLHKSNITNESFLLIYSFP